MYGWSSLEGDYQDRQRKLRFEIQLKERELERLTANGADASDLSSIQAEQLRAAIEKFTVELNQLENGTSAQVIPRVDYLKNLFGQYKAI